MSGARIDIIHADSRGALQAIAPDSIDACVTDPPYALVSIAKRFGADGAKPAKSDGDSGVYARASAGFMGQKWDTGETAFSPAFWAQVLRVLKPGAHLVAFGGTRTFHRLVCSIEDAGFEIRDQLAWVFGSGFPKSHDVSKAIDKAAGADGNYGAPKSQAHAGWIDRGALRGDAGEQGWRRPWMDDATSVDRAARQYLPATPEAARWQGWGTALKPAYEPIVLARKPLIGTVAANVLQHGTGAINIDACRVGTEGGTATQHRERQSKTVHAFGDGLGARGGKIERVENLGRFPANLIHDGSPEVLAGFPGNGGGLDDSRSAARFFYSAKADSADRLGSKHPTVKPVNLMAWLLRLVTPPGGVVLDPFAGSGATGMACMREGFDAILIEREAAFVADIRRRIDHVRGEDSPLFAGLPETSPPPRLDPSKREEDLR